MDNNFAVLFTISSYDMVGRVEIDLSNVENLPVTEGAAYTIFKFARKNYKIRGKAFLLSWAGKLFYIAKTGKDYKTYELNLTQIRK